MYSSVTRPSLLGAAVAVVAVSLMPLSAAPQRETIDYDAIYRIKEEGFGRSRVMDLVSWLTDVYGPRLTNSPGFRKAGEWAVSELASWGLANAKLEPFPFGRGWANERFSMIITTPGGSFPAIGMATAWTPGTAGPVSGDAAFAPLDTEEDFARVKGTLRGKIVFTQGLRAVPPIWSAPAVRFTDKELEELARDPAGGTRGGRAAARAGSPAPQGRPAAPAGRGGAQPLSARRIEFLKNEGAVAMVTAGTRGDGGTFFVQGASAANRQPGADPGIPAVVIAVEHYGRVVRALQKQARVRVELDLKNVFFDEVEAFNVVAEIPGSGKADEVVMLGAHFDSWHGGTGATDNAAGSAVMMEAMRILKQSGLKLRRTVRIGLWGGEEQGLIGSREYVTAHFASATDMVLKPEHAGLTGYFNLDNGTGAIRGVYLQGNEAVAPVFEAWMKPLHNLGMTTLAIRNTSGTDHLSFDRVGLPGFQFIQDEIEYDTRTHHSNMDVYERIQEEDMRKNAVIVAAFAYHAANRDEMLPRKPLPRPPGERGRGTAAGAR